MRTLMLFPSLQRLRQGAREEGVMVQGEELDTRVERLGG